MHIYEIFCNILIVFVELCRNARDCKAVLDNICAPLTPCSWHPGPVRGTIRVAMRTILSKLASLLLAGLLCLTIVSMPRLSTRPLPYTDRLINLFSADTADGRCSDVETARMLVRSTGAQNVITAANARANRVFVPASTAAQQRVVAWAASPPLVAPERTG
jgi:hypothetical protein